MKLNLGNLNLGKRCFVDHKFFSKTFLQPTFATDFCKIFKGICSGLAFGGGSQIVSARPAAPLVLWERAQVLRGAVPYVEAEDELERVLGERGERASRVGAPGEEEEAGDIPVATQRYDVHELEVGLQ